MSLFRFPQKLTLSETNIKEKMVYLEVGGGGNQNISREEAEKGTNKELIIQRAPTVGNQTLHPKGFWETV